MAGQHWFSAQELADMRLPGLPTSKRRVNILAETLGWRDFGPERVRPRQARGGGMEYHVSVLPYEAQQALLCRKAGGESWMLAAADDKIRATEISVRSQRFPSRALLWLINQLTAVHRRYIAGGKS